MYLENGPNSQTIEIRGLSTPKIGKSVGSENTKLVT